MDLDANLDRFHQNSIEFLFIDLDLAMTMLRTARITKDPATAERNKVNARKAHDTVQSYLDRLPTSNAERDALVQKLATLRYELETL